jgi:hypothetical protein
MAIVACDDIAACGVNCLMAEEAHNREHLIVGPEKLNGHDVCQHCRYFFRPENPLPFN